MKKLTIILSLMAVALSVMAHLPVNFGPFDAESQIAIINYVTANDGTWVPQTNVAVSKLEGIAYALDPKQNTMYVKTQHGNFKVQLSKNQVATYKKDDRLKKMSGDELNLAVNEETRKLQETHNTLNSKRTAFVRDSIAQANARREAERREREEAARREEQLRNSQQAHILPTGGLTFTCEQCGDVTHNAQQLKITGIVDGRIYHLKETVGPLGVKYERMHVYPLRSDLQELSAFRNHMKTYGKFITEEAVVMSNDQIKEFNREAAMNLRREITRRAPHGYFSDVNLDCNNGEMAVTIYYTNSSKSTITSVKLEIGYDDYYGNERTATFTLKGPIKSFEGTEYVNENTGFPCPSSVNNTHATITYSNGQVVDLWGSDVIFYNEE